jgi:hypothetical protein
LFDGSRLKGAIEGAITTAQRGRYSLFFLAVLHWRRNY